MIVNYDDYRHETHADNDRVPMTLTPLGFTLENTCTEASCDHPLDTAEDLVFDFDKHGASWTDNGIDHSALPRTDQVKFTGPLKNDPLNRKGTMTIVSAGGWVAIDTASGRVNGWSQAGKTSSGNSENGLTETGTVDG